ncbi:MAG: hypothetical protein ACREEW_18130 [Caulobacteraceae bacterium]
MPSTGPYAIERPGGSAIRALARLVGLVAWAAAAAIGAALALFFAATVVVIGLMTMALLALTAGAARARKAQRRRSAAGVIDAHRIGGHSWVAYGWDGRR